MYDLPYLAVAALFIVGMAFAIRIPDRWRWPYTITISVVFVVLAIVTLSWGHSMKNNLPTSFWSIP